MNSVLSKSDMKSTGESHEVYTQDTHRLHRANVQDPPKLQ